MKNTISKRLAYCLSLAGLVSCLLASPAAHAQDEDLCGAHLRVAFINGIRTTQTTAEIDRDALKATLDASGRMPAAANYTAYHNSNDGTLRDLFEVLVQKLDEGAIFRGRYELIWYFLQGGDPNLMPSWLSRVLGTTGLVMTAAEMSAQIASYLANPAEAFLTDALNIMVQAAADEVIIRPELAAARARVIATTQKLSLYLTSDLSSGYNVLMVPHSQGNLYANRVYDAVAASGAFQNFSSRVRVVHVGVPSATTGGRPYTTALQDKVIGALRILAPATLPGTHNVSTGDFLRHDFKKTYLENASTQGFIVDESIAALTALNATGTTGGRGYFWVTTTWNNPGDIDLHVFEPGGTHVYYGHMQGVSGYLDRDDIPGTGPEHYYATCNAANLQLGTYTVKINNYGNRASGTVVNVSLNMLTNAVPRQVSFPVEGPLGSTGDSNPPYSAFTVQVSKDSQGKYVVTSP